MTGQISLQPNNGCFGRQIWREGKNKKIQRVPLHVTKNILSLSENQVASVKQSNYKKLSSLEEVKITYPKVFEKGNDEQGFWCLTNRFMEEGSLNEAADVALVMIAGVVRDIVLYNLIVKFRKVNESTRIEELRQHIGNEVLRELFANNCPKEEEHKAEVAAEPAISARHDRRLSSRFAAFLICRSGPRDEGE